MIPVTILHKAEVELREAVSYYENNCSGLGLDFEAEVERSVKVIRQAPERWALCKTGTRRYLMQRFPFIIYLYEANHIWIIAVAHCKREPQYWSDRI
ncbi:MAG: type II toxin-antitoxin system RelE/ParE family toxin [Spartobacteria bacterium]|nr:type II toxin-antitoxin system RelE/ParE family toxin [Spartobacteria bacterium]